MKEPASGPRTAAGDERPKRRRATSYDVALQAGVSQSAVSRVLSGAGGASDDVRQRVTEAAAALNYRPNAIARSLITQRSNLVGLVVPWLGSLYYPEFTLEITAEVTKRGARVLLMSVNSEAETASAIDELWTFRVDGVIAATRLSAERLREFDLHQTPVIFYNHEPPLRSGNVVTIDHAEAQARMVERLWASGARRFGVIAGPKRSEVAQVRLKGVEQGLARCGAAPAETVFGDFRYEGGIDACMALHAGGRRYDALVCVNDATALGAMDAARHTLGLRVPADLSITGFDGFGAGRWLSYELTTLRQPLRAMAAAAVDMLFARIDDGELGAERRLFAAELAPGRSAILGADLGS